MFQRCPFCHRLILSWFYKSHEEKHTERRSDGQFKDHITAAPALRYTGPLDGIPQGYGHAVCGVVTQMPEDIIRTYLVNPLTYSDGSFCCGCGEYVESSQLVWQETGETVMDYMGRLRLTYLRTKLGMPVPDRPSGVTLTPAAEVKLRSLLQGTGPQAVVQLTVPEPGTTDFSLGVAPSMNKATSKNVSLSKVPVVVLKQNVKRAAGVVINYEEKPKAGFSISRLHAPE